jgi:hypothetical protein
MVDNATRPDNAYVPSRSVTHGSSPSGPSPNRDEMDALRDVAFHHAVEAEMIARLASLGLINVSRGVWVLTKKGKDRLIHGH